MEDQLMCAQTLVMKQDLTGTRVTGLCPDAHTHIDQPLECSLR